MEDRSFWMLLGAYTFLMIAALLILFFSGYSTIDLINVAVSMSTIYVSILMVYVTAKSVEATKYVGELGIKPLVIAYIRPARAFSEEMRQIHGWMPGVGIFVESIGNGPALNGKIMCTLRGEKEERIYEMNFGRMRPGQRYTYPSISQPNLEIKDTDKELVIEIEYDDAIRKHHKEEPTIIEIIEDFFKKINNDQV